jgi:hypothetical protein
MKILLSTLNTWKAMDETTHNVGHQWGLIWML